MKQYNRGGRLMTKEKIIELKETYERCICKECHNEKCKKVLDINKIEKPGANKVYSIRCLNYRVNL